MIVIGIDPGRSGGIAVIQFPRIVGNHGMLADCGVGRASAIPMPDTPRDLLDHLDSICEPDSVAFVEQVNAGPKMGSSAAFKFGQNVGEIRMACIAAGLSVHYVSPQKWQRELGLLSKGRGLGQGDTEKKNRNKAKAQELFPGTKCTHAIADALLIAEYGRRMLAARK